MTEPFVQELYDMVEEARGLGALIHCSYQDLWWTPDEFKRALDDNKFHWGRVNFRLVSADKKIKALKARVVEAQAELDRWMERL